MNTYRIGFGFFGKLAVVATLGATLAGGIAMADAKPAASLASASAEVVRLEPVTVTISKARFDALRAEGPSASAIARR